MLALWLLLSGVYKPLVIGFGVATTVLVLVVARRMDRVDGDRVALPLNPIALIGYFFWLLVEISKSNWTVTRIILAADMPIRQHLFAAKHSQKSDLGQVIFANSITLTPGTVTVETEPETFLVHALAYSPDDMDSLRDMDRRVTAIEGGNAA